LADGEPYAYSALQRFTLDPDRVRVELGITNRGVRAMPFGLGLHPWWNREPGVMVSSAPPIFGWGTPTILPQTASRFRPELDFSPRPSAATDLAEQLLFRLGWTGGNSIPKLDLVWRIEADPIFTTWLTVHQGCSPKPKGIARTPRL